MKKHLFHFLLLSAVVLTGGALVGCGDEVQELANDADNEEAITETSVGANSTLFSSGGEGTRTWMDTGRKFYWSEGDQIYVNTSGTNYKKTSKSTLLGDGHRADFVLEGVTLTAEKCSVVYIGNGTTAATATKNNLKVKIESKQTQAAWGDSKHLGASGDCGVAEAEKDAVGKYTFDIRHKAAYLIFQPYRPTGTENPDWKLMKIEIIANGTTLAGTYDFGTGELVGTGSSNTIEFNCGTDGFDLNHTAASAANSCFVVIQPGQHELTIRYTVEVAKKSDVIYYGLDASGIFTVEKKIDAKAYNPNGVTTIKHELRLPFVYYEWDAQSPTGYNNDNYNPITFPTNASEIDTHRAMYSCKDMPNANEMYWYIVNGDPHWDETTPWSIDGGLNVYTNGLWLKKETTIVAEGKTFRDDIGIDGVDMRLDSRTHSVTTSQAVLPAAERSKYFFLPALGYYFGVPVVFLSQGNYWSSSPFENPVAPFSYKLHFYSGNVEVGNFYRANACVAEPSWFQ